MRDAVLCFKIIIERQENEEAQWKYVPSTELDHTGLLPSSCHLLSSDYNQRPQYSCSKNYSLSQDS